MSTTYPTCLPARLFPLAVLLVSAAAAGCQGETGADDEDVGLSKLAVEDDDDERDGGGDASSHEAKRLFRRETFGGNGRTCTTCHGNGTGTLSPEEAQERFAENPADPLFVFDGSDDFQGHGVNRILADATILIRIPLPPNITLANDPTATSVVLRRGIPTTKDTPALDPVLMYDGRAATLADQATGAIHGHAQSTIEPTADQVRLITEHEKTDKFFSSSALRDFAAGGPAPGLPQGNSPAQKRGRKWFEDVPVTPALTSQSPRNGLCAQCHSGPLLNETNGRGFLPLPPFPTPPQQTSCSQPAAAGNPVPKGRRFETALVSEVNLGNEPMYSFLLKLPFGGTVPLPPFADPGRALITGNFRSFPALDGDLFKFKIPTVRGVKKTAPYFHNNSAKTLEDLVAHYATFFRLATDCNMDGDPPLLLTAQDQADLVAFLKLL